MRKIVVYTAMLISFNNIVWAEDSNHAVVVDKEQSNQSLNAENSDQMNYAKALDRLNKQLQLMAAENAISDQRLKAVEIKRKMNGDNGNGYSNNVNSASNVISPVSTSSPMNHGVEPPAPVYAQINYFSLQKISGSLSNPTAWIAFNNSVAQVQTGDQLNNDWKVKSISPNTVMLEDTANKKTMQLYLAKATSNSQNNQANQNNQK